MGYITKTNVFYYILKYIYCENSSILKTDFFFKYFDLLMNLIEEGVESLDNVALISTHNIVIFFIFKFRYLNGVNNSWN